MVSKDNFRALMSVFATGVTVVTTLDEMKGIHGMSANSFTSVCLEPPLVLVCVGHNTNTYRYMKSGGCFGVNVLRGEQAEIGRYFARSPENRHGDVKYEYSLTPEYQIPAIDGVLAFFGCQVVSSHVYGDHTIYIGEVKEMRVGDPGSPLIFYDRQWYTDVDRKS